MTSFMKTGNTFSVIPDGNIDLQTTLPVGTYTVRNSLDRGLYLEEVSNMEVSGKIYGGSPERAERILNTFNSRKGGTGVLLTGRKGSGKTLLTKLISEYGRLKYGAITVLINSTFSGENFNRFLSSITQPAIILFDEFEKTYNKPEQEELLTLLDGVYPTKKLFLLTCNEEDYLSSYMIGRPGRIFYKYDYGKIPLQDVIEFCQDNLEDKSKIKKVVKCYDLVHELSYDILNAICEEVNRYPEDDLKDILNILNVEESDTEDLYRLVSMSPDITEELDSGIGEWVNAGQHIDPIRNRCILYKKNTDDNVSTGQKFSLRTKPENQITFEPKHLVGFEDETFYYNNGTYKIVIKKYEEEVTSLYDAL